MVSCTIPETLFLHYSHREEEAIKLDGLSVSEMKQLRDQAEKFAFQAEVNRMMKLIINSLYRNKEVCVDGLIFSRTVYRGGGYCVTCSLGNILGGGCGISILYL